MKKLFLAIALVISLSAISQIKNVHITASGLTCSMCSKSIFKALSKVPSVSKVDADIKGSGYTIFFKEDAVINFDELKNAVDNAGFSVAIFKVVANFSGLEIANNTTANIAQNKVHFIKVNKQTLNGEKTVQVVDKGYLTDKEYNKYKSSIPEDHLAQGASRIYHVTL